jgi:RHS repeat-associated protein
MAEYIWENGVSGDWTNSADWDPGAVPTSADDASVEAGGTYKVTISTSVQINSLILDASSAIIEVTSTGSLTLSSTLSLEAGTFQLDANGRIVGGTLSAPGGSFAWNGGTLDGVTYEGLLDLTPPFSSVSIADGLTATGSDGTGPGAIGIGEFGIVYFDDTQTIDNATITIEGPYAGLQQANVQSNDGVLTLGPNLTIDQTSGYSDNIGSNGSGTIDNKGTILAESDNGPLTINPTSFINDGSIAISNDDTLSINPSTFMNGTQGTITVDAGSALIFGSNGGAGSFINDGTITANQAIVTFYENLTNTGTLAITNSTVNLYGDLTTAQLAPFANVGDTIALYGTLDNDGATLNTGPGGAFPQIVLENGATIKGGTILDAGSGLRFNGGTLDAVTYEGTLNLTSSVSIANSLTLAGSNGTGPGAIDIGYASNIYFDDTQTIDDATITFESSYAELQQANVQSNDGVLTLGTNLTIDHMNGGFADGIGGSSNGSTIDNQGTILAEANDGSLTIDPTSFINDGSITVSNGDALAIQSTNFTNDADATITVDAGSTLVLGSYGDTGSFTNAGMITADQAIVTFYEGLSTTGTLAITNSTVDLYGDLTTAQLAPFADAGDTIALYGTLDNDGATLDAGAVEAFPQIVLENGATIKGGTILDAGSGLRFNGGTLNGVTYEGTLDLNSSVYIADGLTVTGSDGTGPGAIDIGYASNIYFDDTQTIDDATITFESSYAQLQQANVQGLNGVLTLGTNLTIDHTNGGFADGIGSNGSGTIDNQGTILAEANSGSLTIDPASFINDGSITVSNGDALSIQSSNFTNDSGGTISVGAGSALVLGSNGGTGSFVNDGKITADQAVVTFFQGFSNTGTLAITNSTVAIYGDVTTAQLTPFANVGDAIALYGTLDNDGATLNAGPGATFPQIVLESGATIEGGTILDSGSGLRFNGGTLDGVTYQGTLDLTSSVSITNGLMATGSNGTGPGTIDIGYASNIYFDDTQTIDDATITIENSYAGLAQANDQGSNGILTLGPGLTINHTGGFADEIGNSGSGSDTIDNQGKILADANGGSLTINPSSFVNDGSIAVSNGDTLTIQSSNFTNDADATITVDTGSTLVLGSSSGAVLSNFSSISVATDSHIIVKNAINGTGSFVIENDGTLEIAAGTFANSVSFAQGAAGTLKLDPGATIATAVSGFATGDAIDFGDETVSSAAIANGALDVTFADGTSESLSLQNASESFGPLALMADGTGGTEVFATAGPGSQALVAGLQGYVLQPYDLTTPPTTLIGAGIVASGLANATFIGKDVNYNLIPNTGGSETGNTSVQAFLNYSGRGDGNTLSSTSVATASVADTYLELDGYINLIAGHQYQFTLNSSDGSRLYVDGVLAINSDYIKGSSNVSGQAITPLSSGLNSIAIEYYDSSAGGASIDVSVTDLTTGTTYDGLQNLIYHGTGIPALSIADTAAIFGSDGKYYINGAGFNGGQTTLSGEVAAGYSDLTVTANGVTYTAANGLDLTGNADGSSTWTLALSVVNGETISAQAAAEGPDGTQVTSAIYDVTVKETTSESLISDSDVFTANGLNYLSGTGTTLNGTAEAGDAIVVTNGQGAVVGGATASANGAWSVTLTGLQDGNSYSYVATATDAAGNQAVSPAYTFTIDSQVIDWNAEKASLKPPGTDQTDWNLIWNRFEAQVGDTVQSLYTELSQDASTLGLINETPQSVSDLLVYELQKAAGTQGNLTLSASTDLAGPATAGFDLALTRVYSSSFIDRNGAGVFGDGWTFNYDIKAVTDSSGNVTILTPSGEETFAYQAGGGYTGQAGDQSVLTLSDGHYVLTQPDGTVETFRSDGQLSTVTDSNNNTLTLSYDSNGIISGVTSSNGQSLSFTTNAQGRITSATDNQGQTVTYTYDSTGDLLLSTTGSDGTTTYNYDSSGNPYTQNALTEVTNPDGTQENFQYDNSGDLISTSGTGGTDQVTYSYGNTGTITETDGAGNTATQIYDTSGNLEEVIDAEGNATYFSYDSLGELTGIKTPAGDSYSAAYDSNGNLTTLTDANGGTVTATYQPGTNLLTSYTDQNGNTTDYNYNAAGDLTGVTYDDGSGASYQYAANGELTQMTDALGQTTQYSYNSSGELTAQTFSDGTSDHYSYDADGDLISAQAQDGSVTSFTYNTAGELASVTDPHGRVETYSYDSAGREIQRIEPDGSITNYGYNADGQLSELSDGSGNLIVAYSYNSVGELDGANMGNGASTSYAYDAKGDVTQIVTKAADGSVTSDLDYTYDSDGNPITVASQDGTWTYAYDASGQLMHAVFASTNAAIPDQDLTYEYDAAGNRTQTIFNGAVTNYTTNGLNQYTSANGTVYSYNADGNLVSKTDGNQTWTYTYNFQNELTSVAGPDGTTTYQYDALGDQVASTVNGVTSDYVIDPQAIDTSATGPLASIAQVYNAAGDVTATYDYGIGLAAVQTDGTTDYYNADANGNVTSLSGAGGSLVDTYDYTPSGTLLATTGTIANPFQYSGAWAVTTDTDGLISMRARYYDPATGAFISRDPLGLQGSINLYQYAANAPTENADPTGLDTLGDVVAGLKGQFDNVKGVFEGSKGFFQAATGQDSPKTAAETVAKGILGIMNEAVNSASNGLGNHFQSQADQSGLSADDLGSFNQSNQQLKQNFNNNSVVQYVRDGNKTPLINDALNAVNQGLNALNNGIQKLIGGRGDVHLTTFDGLHYDFQAEGEFVLAKSLFPGDSFQVQARLSPWYSGSSVSVMTEIGAQVGTDRVTFGLGRDQTVWVDGTPSTLSSSNTVLDLNGGQLVELSPTEFQLTWNTGEQINVTNEGTFLDLSVAQSAFEAPGLVEGLLGPNEGQANDFQLADGTVLSQPLTSAELYGEFANAWRVTDQTSLLDYGAGQTTATFTDVNFPGDALSLADLPQNLVNQAAQAAAAAGITDPTLAADAELDYLATGDANFITSAASAQQQGQTVTPATIVQSTPPAPALGVAADAASVVESDASSTPVTFDVYLTGAATSDTDVNYKVVAAGTGFFDASSLGGTLPSGDVTIAAGQTSAQFTIDVPNSALGNLPSQNLEVQIQSPGSPIFAATAEALLVNNEPVPGNPTVPVIKDLSQAGTLVRNSNTYTLDLGNLTLGVQTSVSLAVANLASALSDTLSGYFTVANGSGVTFNGYTFAPLQAGQVSSAIVATIDTSTAGTRSETLTLSLQDSNVSGYSAPLSPLSLTINYAVVPSAQAVLNSPTTINFGNVRLGTAPYSAVSVSNSAASGSAALDATVSAANGSAEGYGVLNQLAPGGSNSTNLFVGLNTSVAGQASGIDVVTFASDTGAGGTSPLPSQAIEVTGSVYRPASASIPTIIVHEGDPTTLPLAISNSALADGYSENLIATVVNTTGSVTASGSTPDIAPQTTDNSIILGFSTSVAGEYAGSVSLDFTSDGGTGPNSIDGLGTKDLGQQTYDIAVNNYAAPVFVADGFGPLAHNGNAYTLDLGDIAQGSGPDVITLAVDNAAAGLADELSGTFKIAGDSAFTNSGFNAFSDLLAGDANTTQSVSLNTDTAGVFTEIITLDPTDSNASGYSASLSAMSLTISGTVTSPACYCAGTLIATLSGERSVEELSIGDVVMTKSGAARPIKWIGRRSYCGRFIKGRKDILPVYFKKDSLGESVPKRDLWISPNHAMFFENASGGILIEAKDLVNGVSIVQACAVERIDYFHIELETHDVIIAEGAPSETFIDDDSRGMFQNAFEFAALYPAGVEGFAQYCAPRLDDGFEVECIRRKIAALAGISTEPEAAGPLRGFIDLVDACSVQGWAQDCDHPDVPVCLAIHDGETLLGHALASGYRADLAQAGVGNGHHAFVFRLPTGKTNASPNITVVRAHDRARLAMTQIALAVQARGKSRLKHKALVTAGARRAIMQNAHRRRRAFGISMSTALIEAWAEFRTSRPTSFGDYAPQQLGQHEAA